MKRTRGRNVLLLLLPFVLLLPIVVVRSGNGGRMVKNHAIFAQDVRHEIPVGIPEPQAEEFLKSNGFSMGASSNLIPAGKRGSGTGKRIRFMRTQAAYQSFWNRHAWEVVISVQNNRVRSVEGAYYFS